jgi:ABC-type multidrug transport system fused ATPase/permease subunit
MTTVRKLWFMLDRNQKRAALILMGAMLVGMVLETLGIGLVIPALGLMASKDIAATYPSLAALIAYMGYPSHATLVGLGMLALVVMYAIKAVFLAALVWMQAGFAFGLQASLSQRLFSGYLFRPYAFHLQRNSAQLIRNATGEVNLLTSVALSAMILLTETLVLLGIAALLLTVEPFGALLVISTLGVAAWGFHRFTRARILRWGQARQYHEGLRIQHLQQGLGGAKDVKLLGREDDFLFQYATHNASSANVARRQNALQQLPRLWLEWLAVMGLGVLVFVMIGRDKPVESLLPTLGLFAAAAFRLMPSLNRSLASVQNLRYATPVINTLYEELKLFKDQVDVSPQHIERLNFENQLVLENVSFRYPATDKDVLQNIDLVIKRGTSVGFVGGSGAGKSTLVDIVLGLLKPDSGCVKIDGIDIQSNLRRWQNLVGYVPQVIFLTDDTLRRNVAFGIPENQIDDAAVGRAVAAAQMSDFIDSLPEGLETVVGERGIRLSGGQRQRIGIARALYHDPSVLVLDEATSSLDLATENGVMNSVRALHGKKTILIVAHRHSTVEHCDLLYGLRNGRVINSGPPSIVLRDFAANEIE